MSILISMNSLLLRLYPPVQPLHPIYSCPLHVLSFSHIPLLTPNHIFLLPLHHSLPLTNLIIFQYLLSHPSPHTLLLHPLISSYQVFLLSLLPYLLLLYLLPSLQLIHRFLLLSMIILWSLGPKMEFTSQKPLLPRLLLYHLPQIPPIQLLICVLKPIPSLLKCSVLSPRNQVPLLSWITPLQKPPS